MNIYRLKNISKKELEYRNIQIYKDKIENGKQEARIEVAKKEVAKKLLEKMTIKEVSEITGLSEKQIEEL